MIPSFQLRLGRLRRKSENTSTDARTRWGIVALVWLAGLGAGAQFGKVAVSLAEFRHIYDVGEVALGFLISCVGSVGLTLGVVGGILISRAGIRRAFVAGMIAAAVLSAVQALIPPYPVMIVLRVLEGACHLAIVIAGPILMARHSSPGARGPVMTLWSTFFGLSYMIVALIAPLLLEVGGVRTLLLAHSVYMLVLGVVLWRHLPPPLEPVAPAVPHVPFTLRHILRLHVQIYRSPLTSAAALGFVWYTGLYIALLTYLPSFVDDAMRTRMSAVLPMASIVTGLSCGMLLLRFVHPVRAVQIGFACTGLAAVPMLFFIGQDARFFVVAIVLLATTGLIPGPSFAALAALNTDDEARAHATGAVAQMGNLGTTTGPPLLAAIVAGSGIYGAVAFTLACCGIGIVVHELLKRRRDRRLL